MIKKFFLYFKPKGLHPDDSKKVKAENLDRTIETEEEKEKEGEPGKQVRMFNI